MIRDNPSPRTTGSRYGLALVAFIATVVLAGTAVWPSPKRVSAELLVDAIEGVNGVHPADTAGTHYHIRFQ